MATRRTTHRARRRGRRPTAATRAKISAALRGRRHPHKGHRLTSATRAKISRALKGKHHKGHPLSPATRAKISAALKARHADSRRKAGPSRRSTHHTLRRSATARHLPAKAIVKAHRIRAGARRSLFRTQTGFLSERHQRWFRTNLNPHVRGFIRGGR